MKLSVAVLTRNNEDTIKRCLDSVNQADEIVLVDTGSTDKTKEIASEYGKVYEHEWIEDFSAIRNFALSKCTGDWVLMLDSDEWVEDLAKIRAMLLETGVIEAVTVSIYYEGVKTHNMIRIVRPNILYQYPIHEYPITDNVHYTEEKFHHLKGKSHNDDPQRNVRMLRKAVKDYPTVSRFKYYLACECYWHGYMDEASLWFNTYLVDSSFRAEKADAWLFKARIQWGKGLGDTARESCLKSLLLAPACKEALRLMAEMSWPGQAVAWNKYADVADNRDVLFPRGA